MAARDGSSGNKQKLGGGGPVRSKRAKRATEAGLLLESATRSQAGSLEGSAAQTATGGALIGDGLRYTKAVKGVLDRGVKKVNALGHQQRNCEPGVLTGHIAEADHAATFNADAVFQGKAVRATRLSSFKAKSADVVVTDRPGGEVIREVQSKVFWKAEKTADAQRGYGEMDRLTPADQAEKARTYAAKRAASEAQKEGANRAQVAQEYQEVADRTTDRIEARGASSQARTRNESRELSGKAQKGQFASSDIVGTVGRRAAQGAIYGARTGAVSGGAIAGIVHSAGAVSSVIRGEKSARDAAADAIRQTATGALNATVKGAASGAATAAARVVAENVGSRLAKRALGSSAPAMLAVVGCDVALGAISVAIGRKTWAEFGHDVTTSAKVGVSGLLGAEIGFVLGGPIGAVVGGFCLPVALEFAEKWLSQISTAGEVPDPATLASAAYDPANIGEALRAMAASRSGLEQYRLMQMGALFDMLARSAAHVIPGRVVTNRDGYQTSAAIVVVHEGRAFAVDLRPWKGDLYSMRSGSRAIPARLVQRRTRSHGRVEDKEVRNPLLGPAEFARSAQAVLLEKNSRWTNTAIEPIVVFPTGEIVLHGGLAADSRMLDTDGFRARLEAGDGRATPAWMLDDLENLPVWDSIEVGDRLIQAALETPSFVLTLVDGTIEVPLTSVARVEIDPSGAGDPTFAAATIFLKDSTVLAGAVEAQEVVWNWKGRRERHDLRTVHTVCPGGFMLGRSRGHSSLAA